MKLFHFDSCPYCKTARDYLRDLQSKNADYANIAIEFIDERKQPDIAEQYDYYYVPTFYVDSKKVHEGAITREEVEGILKLALVKELEPAGA